MQGVEIGIDHLARIQAEESRVAGDDSLGIPARGHGSEVLGLEVLDDLRPDFDDVGDLLNRGAHLTTALEQHLTEMTGHLHPSKNLFLRQRLLHGAQRRKPLLIVEHLARL